MVTAISAIVFAGVLSAYSFLGRGLARMSFDAEMESRSRTALNNFTQDMSLAQNFDCSALKSSSPYSAPSTTGFTVDVWMPQANPSHIIPAPSPAVLCTATYSYDSAAGTLTVVHRAPVGAAQLDSPGWPTQDVSQSDNPRTILKGVTGLSLIYRDASGNPTTNPLSIKQVGITYALVSPTGFNPASAKLPFSMALVTMKGKGLLQDPNEP